MSLLVKLQPKPTKFGTVSMVTGIKIELTTMGAGKTAATTTPQKATIELYELPGTGDKSTTERLIATLAFELTVDAAGKDPKIDGQMTSPSNLTYAPFVRGAPVKFSTSGSGVVSTSFEAPDLSSDFWVELEVPQGQNLRKSSLLYLPWDSEDEKNVLEIGAKLLIAGTEEAGIKMNNVVSIRLDHKAVPRDGTGPKKDDCFGVGMVYPRNNLLWDSGEFPGAKKATKMTAGTINVFVHEDVITNLAPVTLADLTTRIAKVFADGGLPAPTLTKKSTADLTAAGFEKRTTSRGSRWGCKAALMADADKFLATDGLSMDFFDFWVVWESSLTGATAGEAAEAESIMDFDPTTKKKMLLYPMAILPKCATNMKACVAHPTLGANEYKANEVATTITHEIGHALGLGHGLMASGGTYDIGPSGHYDITRGVMAYLEVSNGVSPLAFFGPVHKAVIAQRFA